MNIHVPSTWHQHSQHRSGKMKYSDSESLDGRSESAQRKPQTSVIARVFRWTWRGVVMVALAVTACYFFSIPAESARVLQLFSTSSIDEDLVSGELIHNSDLVQTSKERLRIHTLPPKFLPETGKHRHSGRLVVVGDVHGMRKELEALLLEVKFNNKDDHLILAGDMIDKGPDSSGVIDLAMELGASCVMGNHEYHAMNAYNRLLKSYLPRTEDASGKQGSLHENEKDESANVENHRKDQENMMRAMGKKRRKWIQQCPHILQVGTLGKMGEVVVVHAGLVPGKALTKQTAKQVMNMRTINKKGKPSSRKKGVDWFKRWNKYQRTLAPKDRTTVIYGHNSGLGLQDHAYTKGLDTSCVNGGNLTAFVIEGGHSHHITTFVQVDCAYGR